MDFITRICVFFMFFGTVHATDWKPKIYGQRENVTVQIDQLEINGKDILEITFSGYTSKLQVSNVMMYNPMKNQTDNISVNINYTGRIQKIQINNGSLSFLLLNVTFMDSGNYTVIENSLEKGKTDIFVPRHRLLGQDSEPMILPFKCNMTNVTSITIEMMISKLHYLVVKYDVTKENYTEVGILYRDRIERCVLTGSTFSFIIRKVTLIDMGMYVAWGDMEVLMDSILVEFEENNTTSSPESTHIYFSSSYIPKIFSSEAENYMLEWIFVFAVVVLVVAAALIAYALRMLQQSKKSKSKSNHLTHRNGKQNTSNSFRNRFKNIEIRHTIDGNMFLKESNISYALTDFTPALSQVNDTLKGKHPCTRRIDSATSNVNKVLMHPILPSSCETLKSGPTFELDNVHQYAEVEHEYRSDQPHLHLKLSTNPTEILLEQ